MFFFDDFFEVEDIGGYLLAIGLVVGIALKDFLVVVVELNEEMSTISRRSSSDFSTVARKSTRSVLMVLS